MLERLKHWIVNLWRKWKAEALKRSQLEEENYSIDWNFRWMLVSLARRDKDLRETHGHNRSPAIDQINKFMGLPMGSAYCLSAIYVNCVQKLCDHMEIYNPLPKTGSTQKFWAAVPEKYKRLPGIAAKKGDICILRNRKNPALGHAFMLSEDETHEMQTLEWNTNANGISDGEGFHELKRTQRGTLSQEYLGAVDVVSMLADHNPSLFEE